MQIFFFDTETTGFGPEDRVIQFAWLFGKYVRETGEFFLERTMNQYINIDEEIPEEAFNIHKINKEKLAPFLKMEAYMPELMEYFYKADLCVWHNISFDIRMMRQEMEKILYRVPEWTLAPKLFCTMKDTPGFTKWPKLWELYKHLFWEEMHNAHDAMYDIAATKDCFLNMLRSGKIKL